VLHTALSNIDLQSALSDALERVRRHHRALGNLFPTVGEGSRYQLTENDNWLTGFWTGLLWLAYAATGDEDLRAHAQALLPSFEERLDGRVHITHDLGFLFTLSARAQWQSTREEVARQLALRAARELLARCRPQGRYVQAWGEVGDAEEGGRIIIDTIMILPLLFWAADQEGDPRYRRAALDHAETSMRYLLRPDGATYHTYYLDQVTGAPIGPSTHQGYADDSLWARGQAWAIYGFAVAAEWSQEPRFVDASRLTARRFMAEMPPDGVPWWDLRLPENAPRYLDSSAGAIAAGGMLRLARLEGGQESEFYGLGVGLLDELVARCLETQAEGQGLLRYGTYHAHKGLGVEAYFIGGDYFFLEALLALAGQAPDFWGVNDR
jgi:unsaturated chondroitin disaccharide hydrolase